VHQLLALRELALVLQELVRAHRGVLAHRDALVHRGLAQALQELVLVPRELARALRELAHRAATA
tara:strand:+ start:1438 stop:1632 length:195 start_codon:yes stop_codon:yes gene_type:complete